MQREIRLGERSGRSLGGGGGASYGGSGVRAKKDDSKKAGFFQFIRFRILTLGTVSTSIIRAWSVVHAYHIQGSYDVVSENPPSQCDSIKSIYKIKNPPKITLTGQRPTKKHSAQNGFSFSRVGVPLKLNIKMCGFKDIWWYITHY